MNKIIAVALAAGGLLLLDAPNAVAHEEIRISYQPVHYQYDYDVRRSHRMPYWLKRDRSFRQWYKHTRLRRQRHLTWHRLFRIYRWETIDRRKHRRAGRSARYQDYYRHSDRDQKRRHRH